MALTLAILLAVLAQPDTVALDNGAIRVEIDLDLFAVRYIGVPGGQNFVAPLFVQESLRSGRDWVDAGGLRAELHPALRADPAITRGPAKVIEKSDYHIVLLGALSESTGVQLKKEIRLDRSAARAEYTVTALSSSATPLPALVYSVVNLPQGIGLIPDVAAKEVKVLNTRALLENLAMVEEDRVRIPIPLKIADAQVSLLAFTFEVAHVGENATWTRRVLLPRGEDTDYAGGNNLMCKLNGVLQRFEAVLMGPLEMLSPASPVTFKEEWIIEKHERPKAPEEGHGEGEGEHESGDGAGP